MPLVPFCVAMCLWVTCAGAVRAQERGEPDARVVQRLDGVSHNTILSLHQDGEGFLWIGTADGLNRYDGYDFVVHRHMPGDSSSLSGTSIRALAETPDGSLWIGTERGVDRMDRASGAVQRYRLETVGSTVVRSLLVTPDGHLWVALAADAGAVFRYNPETDSFIRLGVQRRRSAEVLPVLFADHEGAVWVLLNGESPGLYRHHRGTDRFDTVALPTGLQRKSAVSLGHRRLWVAEGARVGVWDLQTQDVEEVARLPLRPAHTTLMETRDGDLWIGTDTDVFIANRQGELVRVGGLGALSGYVWTLLEDQSGIVWIGTRSGLYAFDPHTKPIYQIREGLGQQPVMAVAEAAGQVWVGTMGAGLIRLDPDTSETGAFTHSVRDRHSMPSDAIWSLAVLGRRIWAGTEKGLAALDPLTESVSTVSLPQSANPFHPDGSAAVYDLCPTLDGALWAVGPWDAYLVDPVAATVKRHVPLGARVDWRTLQTVFVQNETSLVLWFGTEAGGLVRYDGERDRVTRYSISTNEADRSVFSISEGIDGALWLGTDLGLVRFVPETEQFHTYYDPAVMPGAHVYSVLADEQAHLWLGTSKGLVRFDTQTRRARRFENDDGIQNVEFNRRAALRSASGRFYIGSLDGLTTFRPEELADNPFRPPVALTEMRVFSGEGTSRVVPGRSPLSLGADENTFELTFAALSFTDPVHNRYRYRLDGFDADWVEAGTERRARYTRIPPGDYTFRVLASNNDGVWSEEGAALAVSIAPHYWQTVWFRLVVAGVVLAIVVSLYRWRVGYLLGVERLRLRIAADLHDDVGSRLSGIALLSEMVRDRTALPEPDRAELSRIGNEARALVGTLRDIVWFVVPEHDRPGALVERMREVAATLLVGTSYRFRAEPDATLSPAGILLRRNVFLIYREALHNIRRHACAGHTEITVGQDGELFTFTVADDGCGFDPGRPGGQGLANMHRRAELVGGTLHVESRPGAGTVVRLRVPVGARRNSVTA